MDNLRFINQQIILDESPSQEIANAPTALKDSNGDSLCDSTNTQLMSSQE